MKRSAYWIILWAVCTSAVSARASDNILLNPSFEEGGKIPLHWSQGARVAGVKYIWDKANGHESSVSLCLHKTASRYFPIAQWYQVVERQGDGTSLDVSAHIKADKVTKAILDVIFLDGRGKRISHEWAAYIGSRESGEPPASHDWKLYSGRVAIPTRTAKIQVALQIYGPGKVWFDDVRAAYAGAGEVGSPPAEQKEQAPATDDIADVASEKSHAADDPKKTYFLIHARDGAEPPGAGYKLLVVLPGGDGSEAFHSFVKRVYQRGLPDGYLVAQLVAIKWTSGQRIVWPHQRSKVSGMAFTTEQFVEAVIADVKKRYQIDGKHVFTLSWSSGGPAAYAVSLQPNSAVTGSYVAMSVFKPRYLPPLAGAKGHCYYIEHSPADRTCPFGMAQTAVDELSQNGAKVTLSTYQGGHGWRGDVYGRIRKGIAWLEAGTRE